MSALIPEWAGQVVPVTVIPDTAMLPARITSTFRFPCRCGRNAMVPDLETLATCRACGRVWRLAAVEDTQADLRAETQL